MNCGGIVLCGGQCKRMGLPKWALPFGAEPMLQRVVRLLGQVVQEVVVVAAPGQDVPDLPAAVRVVRDRREGRGPLEALCAGLSALPDGCEAAYATGCDVPLLVPAFVARMIDLLGDSLIAVPQSGGRFHPLSAVYRRSVLPAIDALLAADRLRPAFLFDLVATRTVSAAELAERRSRVGNLAQSQPPFRISGSLRACGPRCAGGRLGQISAIKAAGTVVQKKMNSFSFPPSSFLPNVFSIARQVLLRRRQANRGYLVVRRASHGVENIARQLIGGNFFEVEGKKDDARRA